MFSGPINIYCFCGGVCVMILFLMACVFGSLGTCVKKKTNCGEYLGSKVCITNFVIRDILSRNWH